MARPTSAATMGDEGVGSGRSAGVTQLEFTQAMTDFRVMFPDMDADVIEAVLRANQGAVDATIDHLLAMSADNENERSTHPGETTRGQAAAGRGGGARGDNPPSYQQATQEEDLINLDDGTGGFAQSGQSGSKTDDVKEPFDLLSDLGAAAAGICDEATAGGPGTKSTTATDPRHSYTHPSRADGQDHSAAAGEASSDAAGGASCMPTQQMIQERYEENLKAREHARSHPEVAGKDAQFLEDERLALMMQNEEFMAELRNDRDFLSTLEAEVGGCYEHDGASAVDGAHGGGGGIGHQAGSSGSGGRAGAGGRFQSYNLGKSLVMDEALFREKVKSMGKTSKRKFAQMASMFSRRKGAKELLGHAPAPANDHLLLNDEPLVCPDDSDDEKEAESPPTSSSKTPTKGKYTSF